MKNLAFVLIIALFACNHKDKNEGTGGNTSRNQNALMFPFGKDTLVWKKIEKQNDTLKDKFIKSRLKEFENEYNAYNDTDLHLHSLSDLKKDLHVYDFNNDGKDDLIFSGLSGGEPKEIAFILNTSKGFKIVFKDVQEIQNFGFDHHKISSIYMYDDGCCADYIGFNKIYHVDYSQELPQFNLVYLTANFNQCHFPKSYFDKPINFEVNNNSYKIRNEPLINDTITMYLGGEAYKGNTIGLLSKGTKGRAIASEKDSTGRTWWLVEIDPQAKIGKSLFYEDEGIKRVSGKMGWISSRFVKVLN